MRVKRSQFGFGSRGRHRTPKKLDNLFAREVIPESEYKDFWPRYWRAENEREQKRVIADYTGSALVTRTREEAENDTKRLSAEVEIKYVVRRRNKKGQFSKRGRFFQAIRTTKMEEQ